MPPTCICQYVAVPGVEIGYKISDCADVLGTRADMWLRNGEWRGGEGGSDVVIGEVWESAPASPAASCPRMSHAFYVILCSHKRERVGGGC
jgi:hypothetical protein